MVAPVWVRRLAASGAGEHGSLRRLTLNLLRLQSSQEPAGGPRSQWTVQVASSRWVCSGYPATAIAKTPSSSPRLLLGSHRAQIPPSPANTCAHTHLVCTPSHGHTREGSSGPRTPAQLPACAHSPCQVRGCDGLCPPCRAVCLKCLPTPPGQLALCLSLPTRTGSGGPPGTGQLSSELDSQQ